MRAHEFIGEQQLKRRQILVPKDPRTIELHTQQYELAKKWAEFQEKLADLRTKLTDASSNSSKKVGDMARGALMRRQSGIPGWRH